MKTGTVLILAGVGLVGVYVLTRPTTTPLLGIGNTKTNTTASAIGSGLGALLGSFVSSGNGGTQKTFSGPSSGSSTNISLTNSGITPQEVKALDSQNVADYDAQATPDEPVYGIAGLDY